MAFENKQGKYITEYVNKHIESNEQLDKLKLFSFIENKKDRESLLEQFKYTRIIYKFLEGTQAKDSLLHAEIKIQIILYLSIIEYCCDYLISNQFKNTKVVKETMKSAGLKKMNLRPNLLNQVASSLNRDKDDLVISAKTQDTSTKNLSKIRFSDKIDCIGNTLIELDKEKNYNEKKVNRRKNRRSKVLKEIKTLIYYRNNIHLSHELTNNRHATLKDSKRAYKCTKNFSGMINYFV